MIVVDFIDVRMRKGQKMVHISVVDEQGSGICFKHGEMLNPGTVT